MSVPRPPRGANPAPLGDGVAAKPQALRDHAGGHGLQRGDPPWFAAARMLERHALGLYAICFVQLDAPLIALFVASYALRIVGFEAIYHRYFAHRAFKANRVMQCALAIFATQCGLRGPLWFAAIHRDHHKWPDTERDIHSPLTKGFFTAYIGWMRDPRHLGTALDKVPDFARYPEIRWLNRYYLVPLYAGALAIFLAGHYGVFGPRVGGFSALLWGFYVPTLLTLHAAGLIGSVTHVPKFPGNYRRYATADGSSNVPFLGVLVAGAGWHNNHHRCGTLARAGFAWWEVDVSYYFLRLLAALGLIGELKTTVPREILREGRYA
jgi:stearoyl-CoA desaturase (delta-9 desaturase)